MRFAALYTTASVLFSAIYALPSSGGFEITVSAGFDETTSSSTLDRRLAARTTSGTLCSKIDCTLTTSDSKKYTVLSGFGACIQGGSITTSSASDLKSALQQGYQTKTGVFNTIYNTYGYTVNSCYNSIVSGVVSTLNSQSAKCTYPSNSVPKCGSSSTDCTWTCNSGYKTCGSSCILSSKSCVSGVPVKRDSASHICPTNWTSCPVTQGKDTFYECVNTDQDLESCGGCASVDGSGVDCTVLPGISSVSCSRGVCEAASCLRGYALNGTTCVQASASKARRHQLV